MNKMIKWKCILYLITKGWWHFPIIEKFIKIGENIKHREIMHSPVKKYHPNLKEISIKCFMLNMSES